ncbi:alginate biosynthesis two-component system sensor histidine kinase AlgZ [Maricurvus nonylphenolicus]|uniref:sensor histidine kinase n=1 Tax=Maricurvus nonylphenolicus TaxID=1008307 RepID=UPI0036F26771
MPDQIRSSQAFLPNLCSLQAVFLLVLLGELLAVVLTLADTGLALFQWERLGILSFLIQWIVLASAALLCPLRPWLSQIQAWQAGAICYLLVLLVTVVCSVVGLWMVYPDQGIQWASLLNSVLISAIIAGIALRYLYLQQQLSNQKQAELEARIDALQSRIRPHFLFNSMNSIASLIEIDPGKAEKMIVDLSSLFRASLAEPGLVPLTEELALCRRYVEIEQIRLGQRLQLEWHDEQASAEIAIPSLLLQPIVENAIYHGIQPLPQGGLVRLDVSRQGRQLKIEVSNPLPDTGTETPEASLAQGNRLALENIRHRLQAYYGREAGLTLAQQGGLYVTTIHIPIG